jgi:oligopeptide/dipeptide ABC transporter ATP-binding protein
VNNISFTVGRREIFGLIGESGSGKSVTARSILRLLPHVQTSGTIRFRGRDLLREPEPCMQDIRGRQIAMVSQDPLSSLNPVFTIGEQLTDAAVWTRLLPKSRSRVPSRGSWPARRLLRNAARSLVLDMMDRVRLPDPASLLKKYPHELSGGMRQRVLIAMAMLSAPDLLIADEPTTALDLSIQAQLLNLMRGLVDSDDTAIVYISHDLSVVAQLCDRVAVMYAGSIVELASALDLFRRPLHPYTRALLAALSPDASAEAQAEPGGGLNLGSLKAGCTSAPTRPITVGTCFEVRPRWLEIEPGHFVLCECTDGNEHAADGHSS